MMLCELSQCRYRLSRHCERITPTAHYIFKRITPIAQGTIKRITLAAPKETRVAQATIKRIAPAIATQAIFKRITPVAIVTMKRITPAAQAIFKRATQAIHTSNRCLCLKKQTASCQNHKLCISRGWPCFQQQPLYSQQITTCQLPCYIFKRKV